MFSSLVRAGQGVARAVRVSGRSIGAVRAPACRRNMGAHARHIGLPGEHVPIHVSKSHEVMGTVYIVTMFVWMMYRAKEDGLVLLGFEHPWDHMHDDHGPTYKFVAGDDDEEMEEEEAEEAEDDE